MKHRLLKTYEEYLAKLLLETFMPEDYSDLVCDDKPDLRMGENIGVEVTRAISEEGQASGIFEHLKGKADVDERHIKTIQDIEYELLYFNGMVVGYGPSSATIVDNVLLKQAFKKKLQKEYPLSIIDLFIFSPMNEWFEEECIKEFFVWSNDNSSKHFRRIMVFEYPYLYVYDTLNSQIKQIEIEYINYSCCIDKAKRHVLAQ